MSTLGRVVLLGLFRVFALEVDLDEFEVRQGVMAAMERRLLAMRRRRPQLHGADARNNEWQIEVMGCLAEMAVAKYLDRFWVGATNRSLKSLPGDVGVVQVRSTQHHDGHLIVYGTDPDAAPFVLAIVGSTFVADTANLRVRLAGWTTGEAAKANAAPRKGYTGNEFWVPQSRLRPMSTLASYVEDCRAA